MAKKELRMQQWVRFYCLLVALTFYTAPLMASEKFGSIESEGAAEWVYITVMEAQGRSDLSAIIREALDAALLDGPLISEKEIDAAIADDLYLAKSSYEQGDISKIEYERWRSEIGDREIARQELLDAGAGISLEDSYAACELLAALLERPSVVYDHALETYGREFRSKFKALKSLLTPKTSMALLPRAFEVLERLTTKGAVQSLGYHGEDVELWLSSVRELEKELHRAK